MRLKNRKSPLENRLFKFKARPRGDFGVWHLLKLHYEKWEQKSPEALRHLFFWVGIQIGCITWLRRWDFSLPSPVAYVAKRSVPLLWRRNYKLLLQLLALWGIADTHTTTSGYGLFAMRRSDTPHDAIFRLRRNGSRRTRFLQNSIDCSKFPRARFI